MTEPVVCRGTFLVRNRAQPRALEAAPLLASDVSLSFWGGIDAVSALVVDVSHPLAGSSVAGTVFCLPSARGSCTASQVLLELVLNNTAPKAIILRDVDGLACVGALVAQEIFHVSVPDILVIGDEQFEAVMQLKGQTGSRSYACVLSDGLLIFGSSAATVLHEGKSRSSSPNQGPDATEGFLEFELTEAENQMLQKCDTEAQKMALNVLFRYARILAAGKAAGAHHLPSYQPISCAHIDGCTYIGPGGLQFVKRLVAAGGQVQVPTTLNAVSTDRAKWQALSVPEAYARNAVALGDAYLDLGCQPSFTCAPYLLHLAVPPAQGDNVAWGESNAVVFANSVWGARTEKYADYLDICCALAGMVPAVGVHLDENRQPRIVLDATDLLHRELDAFEEEGEPADWDMVFPLLGHVCGSLSDGKVPLLLGLERMAAFVSHDNLKAFCAAYGTTGTSPLIHVAGVTPEARDPTTVRRMAQACGAHARRTISKGDLQRTFRALDSSVGSEECVQLVALGNPHLSERECALLAALVQAAGGRKHPSLRVIACLSREVQQRAHAQGSTQPLLDFGVELVNDTCWCMLLDAPVIPADACARIMTNSGKYAHYGPGLTSRPFRFGSLEDCVRAAVTGMYRRKEGAGGSWLFRERVVGAAQQSSTRPPGKLPVVGEAEAEAALPRPPAGCTCPSAAHRGAACGACCSKEKEAW
mmetsp:Transcript_2305/g.5481  ORF Transcript_2305/g.5481 Transcript_2305/m.5481 type:complete len:702 (+) Transcript_2305:147-2252(+)